MGQYRHNGIFIRLIWIFCLFLVSCACTGSVIAEEYTVNDGHCHLVNSTMSSEGLQALLDAMDASGVDHTILLGSPFIKKWNVINKVRPGYYNDDDGEIYYYSFTDAMVGLEYQKLPPSQQERIYPCISGFNPTDKNAVEHIERVMEYFPGVFCGIGELLLRHDDLSRMTEGELVCANHPALDPVYDYAGAHDLPVFIHSNMATRGYSEPVYFDEMIDVLKRHPDTRIVWCHAGYSRNLTITDLPGKIREGLAGNPNLFIDISWVVYDEVIAPNNTLNQEWVDLIEDFPDRFILGTDNTGFYSTYQGNIRKYDLLLDKLDEKTRNGLSYTNIYTILPKSVKRPDNLSNF